MRLQAHQAVGERVVTLVDQQLNAQEFAARLRHLAASVDEKIIVHPQPRAAVVRAAVRLVLRDLVRVMDLAVIDTAGMDVEGKAEQRLGHDRALEVPTWRAAAPGRIPLHLTLFARGGLAPDRKVRRVALSIDRIDAALTLVGAMAREAAI